MNRPLLLAFNLIALSSLLAHPCRAEDPTTDDLRREVAELRATVAELAKRLDTMEYQRMPRAEIRSPQLAEPRLIVPSYTTPPVQPVRFPVEVHSLPKATNTFKPTIPAYLLFPEATERAMMGPF